MKTKVFGLISLLMVVSMSVFAGNKTEKIKVYGNCSMCESRIEKAAESVEGVQSADWNKETKMLEVTFDDSKTDTDKIELAIAGIGHDTENYKAKDEVYNELPGCCQYDRSKTEGNIEGHHSSQHSGCTGTSMNQDKTCCGK